MKPSDRLVIFDTTLRDGEQAPGIALTPEARHRRLEDLRFDLLHPHEVLPFAAASGDGGARALARYRLGFWIMTGVAILLLVLLVLGRHR